MLSKFRKVKTNDVVSEIMDKHGFGHGAALAQFREEFYNGMLSIISRPEVKYDVKTDRYAVHFEMNYTKHVVKATNEAAQAILEVANEQHAYFGFKLENAVIVDVAVEIWG